MITIHKTIDAELHTIPGTGQWMLDQCNQPDR